MCILYLFFEIPSTPAPFFLLPRDHWVASCHGMAQWLAAGSCEWGTARFHLGVDVQVCDSKQHIYLCIYVYPKNPNMYMFWAQLPLSGLSTPLLSKLNLYMISFNAGLGIIWPNGMMFRNEHHGISCNARDWTLPRECLNFACPNWRLVHVLAFQLCYTQLDRYRSIVDKFKSYISR